MQQNDITIIGAGVVGLSIASQLSKFNQNIVAIEKNDSFGQESSSRNSEVIHSGLYYRSGSLKAQTCIQGNKLLYQLCLEQGISFKRLGKLVVACNQDEVQKIEAIYDNALNSGVKNLNFLDPAELCRLEPQVRAKKVLFSPNSGIIDSHGLMNFLYNRAKQQGVTFSFLTEVVGIDKQSSGYKVMVKEPNGESFSFESKIVVNAAGLCSDKIAEMAGINIQAENYKLSYCKGQYFRIKKPEKFSIKHLVYPPATKIDLGIHVTPDLVGGLRLGPDAKYISEIDYNIDETDKVNFYNSVKKILPSLELEDLIPDTVGVRAKLQKEDEAFRDFVISEESQKGLPGFINLIGIESPGLTACLAIAERVKIILEKYF
ncbi:MAG: NAD(P)/FAD-dependent oxidoreductase [Candidatus Omnitrophica bacterium]|nr:NAD(P)/FAD-dependent oxidoreductase [Candidatus Omnitrophota bacterium]